MYIPPRICAIIGDWDLSAVQGDLEECKKNIDNVYAESGKRGILPAVVGKPWPQEYTDIKSPEGYDYFHELINTDEVSRAGGGAAMGP